MSAIQAGPPTEAEMLVNTRERVVWTLDEKKRLSRCAKDFNAHGDRLVLECGNPLCADPRIRIHVAPDQPTGAVLRCACTDRVFTHAH